MSNNLTLQESRLRNLRAAARCTAKAKRTGERCQCPAAYGYRVCRVHGARGGAPRGAKHPNFKHGQRTREAIEGRRSMAELLRMARDFCDEIKE